MAEENVAPESEDVEALHGSRWSELYKTEDYWAIWLGLAIGNVLSAFLALAYISRGNWQQRIID